MMQKLLNKKEVISISLNKKDKRFLFEEEEIIEITKIISIILLY